MENVHASVGALAVEVAGEPLLLLPERAVYWPANNLLFVADLHFGKGAALRSGGVPLPHGCTASDLNRLESIIAATQAKQLVILGDLFHAPQGQVAKTLDAIYSWLQRLSAISVTLVRGNHDLHAGDPPESWQITCVDEPYSIGPFTCYHDAPIASATFTLSGHIHPAIRLYEPPAGSVRLPCFWQTQNGFVLPSFGTLTGGMNIKPKTGDRVFVIAENTVAEVKSK